VYIVDMSDSETGAQLHVIILYAAYFAESLGCWMDGTCWSWEQVS